MAFFDEKYNSDEFFYGTEANDFLKEKSLALTEKSLILSLGEGEGRNAVYLAKNGHRVIAIDESEIGLKKAANLAKSNHLTIETITCDVTEFQFSENSFDAIISIWFHLPSKMRKSIHEKCVKALKPGGFFILEAYTPEQLNYATGGPKNLDMLMRLIDLKAELHGLRFINETEKIRMIKEGIGHHGMSAVVQILGQKI